MSASKIIKNTTISDIVLDQLGYTIPASSQVDLDKTEFQLLSTDAVVSELTPFLTSGDLVVNDGVQDLTLAEALRFITWPDKVQVKQAGTDKLLYADKLNFLTASVTDAGGGQANISEAASDPFAKALFSSDCNPLFIKKVDGSVELLEVC